MRIEVFTRSYELHEVLDLCFVYPVVFLPPFPRMVGMLNEIIKLIHREKQIPKLTKRPNAWNILSDVPSGLLKKYLANNTSSSLLYRIFLSGGAGSGSSPSERASSCLCLRQNFIHEAREWCGAYQK